MSVTKASTMDDNSAKQRQKKANLTALIVALIALAIYIYTMVGKD